MSPAASGRSRRRRRPPIRVVSMTGFGQAEGRVGDLWLRVELKSVNHRALDFSFSLPPGWDLLEIPLRQEVSRTIHRGKLWVRIYATPLKLPVEALPLDDLKPVLDRLRQMGIQPVLDVAAFLHMATQVRSREMPGVDRVLKLFRSALRQLVESRQAEGKRLKAVFVEGLQQLARGIQKARKLKEREIHRLQDRFQDLPEGGETPPEVADLYLRIRKEIEGEEELVRLESHWKALDETLRTPGPKGRRVEFLLQELHREWTTLAHKSSLSELVHLTIAMREVVDQLKEQARNVE